MPTIHIFYVSNQANMLFHVKVLIYMIFDPFIILTSAEAWQMITNVVHSIHLMRY